MLCWVPSWAGEETSSPPHRWWRFERPTTNLEVTTAEGATYRAKGVAANMPAKDLLPRLDSLKVPPLWKQRIDSIRPSGNAHQLKLALRRPLVDEGCLVGGVSRSGLTLADLSLDLMRRTVESIDQGRISDPLAIYAPVPSNYDPSVAPPGRQLIVASVYGTGVRPPRRSSGALGRRRTRCLRPRRPRACGTSCCSTKWCPSPRSAGGWVRSSRAAISNGQCPGQVGRDRLEVQTPIPGLVLTGDGAGGRGIGMELAATSGMEAATALLRPVRRDPRLVREDRPPIEGGAP